MFPPRDHKQVSNSMFSDRKNIIDLHSDAISMPEQLQYVCVCAHVCSTADACLNPIGDDVVADK